MERKAQEKMQKEGNYNLQLSSFILFSHDCLVTVAVKTSQALRGTR
jgi:hypothetical protein